MNYGIHADAIKNNLIPEKLTFKQINIIYASEADVLYVALFGISAKEWREQNTDKECNRRYVFILLYQILTALFL